VLNLLITSLVFKQDGEIKKKHQWVWKNNFDFLKGSLILKNLLVTRIKREMNPFWEKLSRPVLTLKIWDPRFFWIFTPLIIILSSRDENRSQILRRQKFEEVYEGTFDFGFSKRFADQRKLKKKKKSRRKTCFPTKNLWPLFVNSPKRRGEKNFCFINLKKLKENSRKGL